MQRPGRIGPPSGHRSTDEIDKSSLSLSLCYAGVARATAWQRARRWLRASPGCLIRMNRRGCGARAPAGGWCPGGAARSPCQSGGAASPNASRKSLAVCGAGRPCPRSSASASLAPRADFGGRPGAGSLVQLRQILAALAARGPQAEQTFDQLGRRQTALAALDHHARVQHRRSTAGSERLDQQRHPAMRGQHPGLGPLIQLERQPRLRRHPNPRHTRRVKPTRRPISCPASQSPNNQNLLGDQGTTLRIARKAHHRSHDRFCRRYRTQLWNVVIAAAATVRAAAGRGLTADPRRHQRGRRDARVGPDVVWAA